MCIASFVYSHSREVCIASPVYSHSPSELHSQQFDCGFQTTSDQLFSTIRFDHALHTKGWQTMCFNSIIFVEINLSKLSIEWFAISVGWTVRCKLKFPDFFKDLWTIFSAILGEVYAPSDPLSICHCYVIVVYRPYCVVRMVTLLKRQRNEMFTMYDRNDHTDNVHYVKLLVNGWLVLNSKFISI